MSKRILGIIGQLHNMRIRCREDIVSWRKEKREQSFLISRNIHMNEEDNQVSSLNNVVQPKIVYSADNNDDSLDKLITEGYSPVFVWVHCLDCRFIKVDETSPEAQGYADTMPVLMSTSMEILQQSAKTIADICAVGCHGQDVAFLCFPHAIVGLVNLNGEVFVQRNLASHVSSLCAGSPTLLMYQVAHLLPYLKANLQKDIGIRSDSCWALAHISGNDYTRLLSVPGVIEEITSLLFRSNDPSDVIPALRCLRNTTAGTLTQMEVLFSAGFLLNLNLLLRHENQIVVKEAARLLSNLCAGNEEQIQALIASDLVQNVRGLLMSGNCECEMEAALILKRTLKTGSVENVRVILDQHKLLKPFLDLLAHPDAFIQSLVLEGLESLFLRPIKWNVPLRERLEGLGGLHKLNDIIRRENNLNSQKAQALVEKHFICPMEVD